MIKVNIDQSKLMALERRALKKQKQLTSQRAVNKSLKKGANIGRDIAKSMVSVKSGELRDSIEVIEAGDTVQIIADKPYATVSEYKDRAYMRPAMKSTKLLRAIADEHKKNI